MTLPRASFVFQRLSVVWRGAAPLFAGLLLASSATAAAVDKRPFDLPADTVEHSLKRLSSQSGIQVVFAPEITDGIRANPVKGDFTPMEAASRLLEGTTLRIIHDEKTGVFSVTRISSSDPELASKKKRKAALRTASDLRMG